MSFILIDDAKIRRFSGIRKNFKDILLKLWRQGQGSATKR